MTRALDGRVSLGPSSKHSLLVASSLWLAISACAAGADYKAEDDSENDVYTHAFIPHDAVATDHVDESALPSEIGKADVTLPRSFDVLATQSPVRDQGRRGTCASFVAVAMAEHTYRKLQVLQNPDFSEQYLYWQTHGYVSSILDNEGSTILAQLQSVNTEGVPTESTWPYEPNDWTADLAAHPQCSSYAPFNPECMTNGSPPELATTSPRLYGGEPVSLRRDVEELKSYMLNHSDPIGATVDVLDSSWGGIHNLDGIVTLPTDGGSSVSDSHGIVLVGWNDEMVAQRVSESGRAEVNAQGQALVDRGFFLFRNSWGVTGWGERNSMRAGYGWMSYRYWQRYSVRAVAARAPSTIEPRIENCTNHVDDDADGAIDCRDTGCFNQPACTADGSNVLQFVGPATIPDNSVLGVRTSAQETLPGTIVNVALAITVRHSYVGDLELSLIHPSGFSTVLRRNTGGAADDIRETYSTHAFDGLEAAGTWSVSVRDLSAGDTGIVSAWAVGLSRCTSGCATPAYNRTRVTYENRVREIPDNDSAGITMDFDEGPGGLVRSASLTLNVDHTALADLRVTLSNDNGASIVVFERGSLTGADLRAVDVPLPALVGTNPFGRWHLRVQDLAPVDIGRVTSYAVSITRN